MNDDLILTDRSNILSQKYFSSSFCCLVVDELPVVMGLFTHTTIKTAKSIHDSFQYFAVNTTHNVLCKKTLNE